MHSSLAIKRHLQQINNEMKKFALAFTLLLFGFIASAQHAQHHLVLHLTSADSMVYKGLFKNLHHLKEGFGDSLQIEVVMHGKGVDLMYKNTSFKTQIDKWVSKGIVFVVCENTLMERQISKTDILANATFVKMGIGHLIKRQEEDWSYVKIGF